MKLIIAFLFLFALPFVSCQKVIEVSVNNAAPQIVINGEVTDQPGPYQISLTQSISYTADNVFPAISGASVTIRDNMGLYDSLTETSPGTGVYATHSGWQGTPGNSYTLSVTVAGKTYTAVSTMPQPVNLDSVGFTLEARGRASSIIDAVPYFQDPPGIANYYEFTETINGALLHSILIFDDRLSDGKYISEPIRDDSSNLQVGYQLAFSMYCIEQNVYQYLFELEQIVDQNGFSSVSPSNPDTNLSGGALGIFSAHTLQTKQTIVNLP